ncbi:hypothetical protein [Actinoplanes regularis]|uniref:hypothetical protein n=2 Tax=Actinoplanes regularis TaxID=52697 RepID=UPI001FD350CB|nr:hypothetical protein [Actinoplanes regularis]
MVLSFLVAALLWTRPRLGGATARVVRTGGWLPALRLVVLLLSLYLVGNALFGPRGTENPAAHALFVWLWVGLVPLSVLFGPVWRAVSPLRTLFRLLRLPRAGLRPGAGLGVWPGVLWLLMFVWFELVAPRRTDPVVIGCCLLGYGIVQLGMAVVRGEEWFARGDCFELYSEFAGRLSPLRWRVPLSGLAAPFRTGLPTPPSSAGAPPADCPAPPSSIDPSSAVAPVSPSSVGGSSAVAPVSPSSVGDSPAAAPVLSSLVGGSSAAGAVLSSPVGGSSADCPVPPSPIDPSPAARLASPSSVGNFPAGLPVSPSSGAAVPALAGSAVTGAGLAAFVAVWWGSTIFDSASGSPAWAGFVQQAGHPALYATAALVLVCLGVLVAVRKIAGDLDVAASLIPIAAGYTLAHYLSLLIVEAPRGFLLLIQGWGLVPGASWNVVTVPAVIAGAQVALILLGHVLGVIVAHDAALAATAPPAAVTSKAVGVVSEGVSVVPAAVASGAVGVVSGGVSVVPAAVASGAVGVVSGGVSVVPAAVASGAVGVVSGGVSVVPAAVASGAVGAVSERKPAISVLATLAGEFPLVLFMIGCTWAGLFLLFVR